MNFRRRKYNAFKIAFVASCGNADIGKNEKGMFQNPTIKVVNRRALKSSFSKITIVS